MGPRRAHRKCGCRRLLVSTRASARRPPAGEAGRTRENVSVAWRTGEAARRGRLAHAWTGSLPASSEVAEPPTLRAAGHPKGTVSQPPHGLKVTPQRCPPSARVLAGGPRRAHRKGGDAGACSSVLAHRPVVHLQERRASRNKTSALLGGPARRGQASATAICRARDMCNTWRTPTSPRRRATPQTLRHVGGPTSPSRPATSVGGDDVLSRCARARARECVWR